MSDLSVTQRVKEYVLDNNVATFNYYRAGFLYYDVKNLVDGHLYTFPIETSDLDGASIQRQEKASMLMRYIRSAIDKGTIVRTA